MLVFNKESSCRVLSFAPGWCQSISRSSGSGSCYVDIGLGWFDSVAQSIQQWMQYSIKEWSASWSVSSASVSYLLARAFYVRT